MINEILDLAAYAVGWVILGACLFAGTFLSIAAFYFISDKLKGSN